MSKKVFFPVALLIIIALVSLSCGSKDQAKDIIGKWVVVKSAGYNTEGIDTEMVIEFLSDKTFISNIWGMNTGHWTILDDGRTKLETFMREIKFVTIKSNQMIMENAERPTTKLFLKKK